MLKQVLNIFLLFLSLVQDAPGQHIFLFPYNETKNCNISLVEEMDIILMYGKVDFNGNIMASSGVNFDIKRKSESSFQLLCFVKVPEDCDKGFAYCNCYKTDDPKVFKLALKITALKMNDGADVRVELIYRGESLFSRNRTLPMVFGSETDAVVVYANDQCINFKQTNVTINDTLVIILSMCREKFALHCELQLTNLETNTLVQSGKEIIAYTTNIQCRSNFKLKYSVCNIKRNISFSITSKTTCNMHPTTETNLYVIILSTFILLILAITFGHFCFLRNKKCRKKVLGLFHTRWNKNMHNENNEEESVSLINDNRESNEKSLQEGNTRKSDDQQKKETNAKDVPIRYRDKDFQNLLDVLSQLTCRLHLKRQSFSTHSKKLGCGLVTSVTKYFNGVGIETIKPSDARMCPCPKCLKSKSPSNTWAEIFITTSSAIMRNKNYHKQIMCVLSTADNVTIELRDLTVEHKDAQKSGLCVLKYVTCDQSLINKLESLQKKRFKLQKKVQESFHQDRHHDKIYFAIVYLEDDTKQTCTGSWSEEKTNYNVRTYHYEPEIPFSNIGAPVVLLGYSNIEFEYNQIRNSLGEVSLNNLSTAVFAIEYAQKVKSQ
ncbi:hypothetical protein BgiBS90_019451 [Biomphalaria glabrata]|nr:hypothetical protein BgiBS90_019451 [Biomphalaria glabrata]